ncbi:MAG: tetratricopeptide repeat protein, partial [Methylomonas sp.]|nr:tetratricopeptide repeat protein [Methylomonas sp.]
MTENLPAFKASQELAGNNPVSNSLLGRGLAAIQTKQSLISDQNRRYRESRYIYDRIGGYTLYDFDLDNSHDQKYFQFKISDLSQCLETFISLAKQGFGKAYFPLSVICKSKINELKNENLASYYAHLAFEWCFENQFSNDPELWSDLGVIYHCGDIVDADQSVAYFWFNKAAQENNAQAQMFLGEFFMQGIGVEKDLIKGLYWYGKSTANGYMDYSCMLGAMARVEAEIGVHIDFYDLCEMYEEDYSDETNYKSAFYYYREAAEAGNTKGQVKLGHYFENGLGVPHDYDQAFSWYKRAAE